MIAKAYVETSRGQIHVRTAGQGEREIVFLGCVSTGGLGFENVLPLLAAKDYRCVAVDLMGYGRSDRRVTDWTIADFADNLAEALGRLGRRPTHLVAGHFSALVAMELAARRSSSIRHLVLDGAYIPPLEAKAEAAPLAWNEAGDHAIAIWKKAWAILKRVDSSLVLDADPPASVRESYLALAEHFAFEPGVGFASSTFDAASRLQKITAATLVVSSEEDWNFKDLQRIASLVPGGTARVIPGIHPLHQLLKPERAWEYVSLLEDFFADPVVTGLRGGH